MNALEILRERLYNDEKLTPLEDAIFSHPALSDMEGAAAELAALLERIETKNNALKQLKLYFEENHAERIKYPEYLEFHEYHMIMLALGIVEKL